MIVSQIFGSYTFQQTRTHFKQKKQPNLLDAYSIWGRAANFSEVHQKLISIYFSK